MLQGENPVSFQKQHYILHSRDDTPQILSYSTVVLSPTVDENDISISERLIVPDFNLSDTGSIQGGKTSSTKAWKYPHRPPDSSKSP